MTTAPAPRFWTQIDMTWQLREGIDQDVLTAMLLLMGIEGSELLSENGLRFYLSPSLSATSFLSSFRQMLQTQTGLSPEMITFHQTQIEDRDWMEEWKKHFDVLQLSDHLWVCPSWKQFTPPKGHFMIRMDPGMAFGTGHHASTRLIMQALEDQVLGFLHAGTPASVLDIGTGTGILAIGAALLGASRVVAVDNDPEAVRIAQENVVINGVADRVEVEAIPLEIMRRKFHIIVANIIAETHLQLLPHYAKRAETGGVILLSGIIQEREHGVRAKLSELGWVVLNQRSQGEWTCLTAIRERRRSGRGS